AVRAAVTKHPHARVTNGLRGAGAVLESFLIQRAHPGSGRLVFYRPQAHDDGAHTSDLKGPPQADDAFAGLDLAESGFAGGEHGPLRAMEVERRDLFRGQDAVISLRTNRSAPVRAGEREPGDEQRILRLLAGDDRTDGGDGGGGGCYQASDASRVGGSALTLRAKKEAVSRKV